MIFKQRLSIIAWWLLIILLLIFTPISSALASIIILIIALMLMPVIFLQRGFNILHEETFINIWFIAFLILGLSFALTAEQLYDIIYIFNFLPFILAIPVYFIARTLANPKTINIILFLYLVGALTSVAVGVFDIYVRGFARPEGYYSGALVIARIGLLFGFLATSGFFIIEGTKRYIFLLGPIFALLAIILSGARASFLIFPILALLFLLFLVFDKKQKYRFLVAGAIIVATIIATLFMFFLLENNRIITTLNSVAAVFFDGEVDPSTRVRLEFYAAGWELFKQSPWLGYGWADIPEMAFTILDENNYETYSLDFFYFYNDFLHFAVAAGIIGVGVLCAFLFAPIISALKSPKDNLFAIRLYAISIIILVYVLSGLTDISLGFDRYTAIFTMTIALILGAFREKPISS